MITNALKKSEPARLIVGITINIAGAAIAASQYLQTHHIF